MGQLTSKDKLLYYGAESGDVEGIKALHAQGAGLEWRDKCGRTALALACSYLHLPPVDVIKTLVDLGANVNTYTFGQFDGTPLHDIATNLSPTTEEIAKLLLSNGANALVKNGHGKTPLDAARAGRNGAVVRAIEGHICLFSGWMREFYGDGVANRLDTRYVRLNVIVRGTRSCVDSLHKVATINVTESIKLSGLSSPQADFEPHTIIALWKAKLKTSNVNQDDPTVVISYNSKESEIKLGPAKAGDKQQLQWFSKACKGIAQKMQQANPVQPQVPAVAGVGQLTAEESELAMAIYASLQSSMEDMLPYCGNQTQVVSEAPASTSSTSSSNYNSSAALNVPASGDGTNSCTICWDAPVEGACLPCGHMAGCMSCLNDIKARNVGCPVCRAKVDQVTRIYAV